MVMSEEKQKEIYDNIVEEWIKRHGQENLDPQKLESIKQLLALFPHEDGRQRVSIMNTNNCYLVPIEHIILNGLDASKIENYGFEIEERKVRK